MVTTQPKVLAAGPMARRLRVPVRWLLQLAREKQVPCLFADNVALFEPVATERALAELASGGKGVPGGR